MQGRCLVHLFSLLLGESHSNGDALLQASILRLDPASCYVHAEAAEEGSNIWGAATHTGDPDRILGF